GGNTCRMPRWTVTGRAPAVLAPHRVASDLPGWGALGWYAADRAGALPPSKVRRWPAGPSQHGQREFRSSPYGTRLAAVRVRGAPPREGVTVTGALRESPGAYVPRPQLSPDPPSTTTCRVGSRSWSRSASRRLLACATPPAQR